MSRPPAILPPLPLLREPDVSGLALWAALLMAGSALLAFLSAAPAHAFVPAAEPEPLAVSAAEPGT